MVRGARGARGADVIRLDGVSKRYEGGRGVGPVSLDVAEKTTVALVGASGSGKSTLLRMVVGLVRPDAGRVLVGGTQMSEATAESLRLRIGYVVQESGLFPHLTAEANAQIMAHHLRWDAARIGARTRELAELVQLPTALLTRYPSELSGGERQRAALMRALFLDPDVLLLDEPLGALDAFVRAQLQDDLRSVVRALAKTALVVTHDVAEAAFLADEIAVVSEGEIAERGPSAEIVLRPKSEAMARLVASHRRLPAERE
jgi:osmoprotectant transport system ATP-binding protein